VQNCIFGEVFFSVVQIYLLFPLASEASQRVIWSQQGTLSLFHSLGAGTLQHSAVPCPAP